MSSLVLLPGSQEHTEHLPISLYFIPLTRPVLVKPLSQNAQEALQQHGCTLEPYPRKRPDLLIGYMVTFPENTEMVEVAHNQYSVFFPDGYQPLLVWEECWYHLRLA
jgi:hypothetical protein